MARRARIRRALSTLALLAFCGCDAGCGECDPTEQCVFRLRDGLPRLVCEVVDAPAARAEKGNLGAPSDGTKAKLAKFREPEGGRTRYVAVQAKRRVATADAVSPVPYPLRGGFEVTVTVGVFVERRAENLEGGRFGLEVRDTEDPAVVYGVYARRVAAPPGLEVFAETRDGAVGTPVRLDGASRAVLTIRADGGTVSFASDPGGFAAQAPLASPDHVHYAATAVRGIADRAQVGFTNLAVPRNGSDAAKFARSASPSAATALDHLTEGARELLGAASRLNVAAPDESAVSDAQASVAAGRALLAESAVDVAAYFEEGRTKRRLASAFGRLDAACGRIADLAAPSPAASARKALAILEKDLAPDVVFVWRTLVGAEPPPVDCDDLPDAVRVQATASGTGYLRVVDSADTVGAPGVIRNDGFFSVIGCGNDGVCERSIEVVVDYRAPFTATGTVPVILVRYTDSSDFGGGSGSGVQDLVWEALGASGAVEAEVVESSPDRIKVCFSGRLAAAQGATPTPEVDVRGFFVVPRN